MEFCFIFAVGREGKKKEIFKRRFFFFPPFFPSEPQDLIPIYPDGKRNPWRPIMAELP